MGVETTSNALNGEEIREITKINLNRIVDSIPLLKRGNTFKQAIISFAFTLEAFPKDVPVPEDFEIQFAIPQLTEEDKKDLDKHKQFVNRLIDKREGLNELIDKHYLFIEEQEVIETGNIPDRARIENDLPIPVVTQVSEDGKRAEVYKNANELQITKRV